MMNIYFVNWAILAYNWLLICLRKPIMKAFFKTVQRPTELLHLDFLNYRGASLYRVRHNSQLCYMEAMLNDLFDPIQKRIRIVNTVFKEPVYFYEVGDNKEVFFPENDYPVFFREPDEIIGDGVDFTVCLPPDLRPSTETAETALKTRINGEVNYYKLYSKNHSIQWVQVNS